MTLRLQAVRATLDLGKTLRLLADGEIREVMEIFDAKHPLASALSLADCLHAHIKVDSTMKLPHEELKKAGGTVENEKDGYVKYVFASGMNLIFSSIDVSQDDLREKKAGSRRARPFLDHVGIDIRRESSDAKAIFDAIPNVAKEQGWGLASQGGDRPVYCCHVSVSAKHWVFPKDKPSIEIAYGPLTIDMAKSGCDLRPSDPTAGLADVSCGGDSTGTSAPYYQSADLGKFGTIGENRKPLADKFFAWYGAVFEDGALSAKEKSVIALAVAHAVQCPYCIDAYSHDAQKKGVSVDQMTEAVHVAAAIRGGASLVHGVQMRNHTCGHG